MKRAGTTHAKDLSVDLAGVKLRTPVGVGSIGAPSVRPERLTLDLYAEIFLKHIAAGAGFICLPHTVHVPDPLLADLEKRAEASPAPRASSRPIMLCKAREKASIYALPPGGITARGTASRFWADHFRTHQETEREETKRRAAHCECERTGVLSGNVCGLRQGARGSRGRPHRVESQHPEFSPGGAG